MPTERRLLAPVFLAIAVLSACHSPARNVPGEMDDHQPYHDVSAQEPVFLTGTEPFWGGKIKGSMLTYTTPEKPEGVPVAVERFAGRGGLSFGGELEGKPLTIAITPGDCSDGMSDRHYPFAATLKLGDEIRTGCAWTDARPASEAPQP